VKCPKCSAAMAQNVIDEVEIDLCSECGGLFLDDGEFESFTGIDPQTGSLRVSRFVKVLTKLNKKTLLDELTQVYSRRYYNEFMQSVFDKDNPDSISLIFIDLDHFKKVNDTYGHDAGDLVLQLVTARFRSAIRESRDDFCFRIGGEEFAIILFQVGPEDSFHVAERIRETVESEPLKISEGVEIQVTISAGVALSHPVDTPQSIHKRADQLLYEAKAAGRNRIVLEHAETPDQEKLLAEGPES